MMRKRHMPFEISDRERCVWLNCFKKVLVEAESKYKFPIEFKDEFIDFLESFSSWMVNKE